MRIMLAALVCVLFLKVPGVQAQPNVPLSRHDVTISTGWIGAGYHNLEEYRRWHGSVFGGLSLGQYWTDNLKTDVEAGWLSTVKSENYEPVQTAAGRSFARELAVMKDLRLSLSQSVQFGRNAWVHPFLAAGVDVDYLRSIRDRPAQQGVAATRVSERDLRLVPFVKGGFKIYASDRAFIVQEFKFGVADGLDHALWKTGVGIDF